MLMRESGGCGQFHKETVSPVALFVLFGFALEFIIPLKNNEKEKYTFFKRLFLQDLLCKLLMHGLYTEKQKR
jgi:hypothetical protein